MELLIAAGIAAIGYRMSQRATPPQSLRVLPPVPPPQVTVADARTAEEVAAAKTFEDARDPLRTGVIQHGEQVTQQRRLEPFFRSARTQNTNENVKNRLHDLFTGSVMFDKSSTGTYKSKEEASARFQPLPQQISSSGSAGNPTCWARQMPTASLLQNNVLPTEQIRVGPGLGVGAEVTAADGYHPMLRVMPKNVNEHRINQLEARINIGASRNAARPADPSVSVNRPPRVWDINRRPPEPTMAAVTARTHRSDNLLRCNGDRITEEYFGHPAMAANKVPADATAHTRNRADDNPGLPVTNVTDARNGIGGFTTAQYDTQRLESQQREQQGHDGVLTGNHVRHMAPTGHIMSETTTREMATLGGSGYLGGAGHMVPTGANRPFDATRTTIRETTAGPNENGAAAPVHKAPMVQCTYQQLNKEARRYAIEGYVPGVERTSEYRRATIGDPDPWEMAGICKGKWMALKERDDANRVMSHGAAHSMYLNMVTPGESASGKNKLPEVNRRQDFGLAQQILAKNEFHVSIT